MPVFAQQPVSSTTTADDVARRAVEAQAGSTWGKARYFAFTFNVDRDGKIAASFPEKWDRSTGDYHVSGKDQKGDALVIAMNVNTMKGRAWKNGVEATAAELPDLLLFGYRRYINDTYWLLMPLKMMDPGVHRTLDGERSDASGRKWDVVKLTFDQGVGLSPGDVYWAWVNRDTGIVEQWDMKLQGTKPDDPPVAVKFHEFRRVGNVLISTAREVVGKKQTVRLDDLVIANEVPKGAFTK
ncbi:MAG: hypothetical protein JWO97_4882 [Acidobacteria bacterium]|nr:hypothetical protein [Acidobacteriota bacterium]